MKPPLSPNTNFTFPPTNIDYTNSVTKSDSPNVISFGETAKLKKLSDSIEDLENFKRTRYTPAKPAEKTSLVTIFLWIIIVLIFTTAFLFALMSYNYHLNKKYHETQSTEMVSNPTHTRETNV